MSTLCTSHAGPALLPYEPELARPAQQSWLDSRRTIHLIVGFAVLLRSVALACVWHLPLVGDATLYHDFALRILQHKTIYPLAPPFEGYYLATVYWVFGISPIVARVSMLPISVAFLYVLYSVTSRFAGRKCANLLTIVFAVLPLNLLCSIEPITEVPASLLLLIVLSQSLRILDRERPHNFLLLGAALGLLILTRPSALSLLVVLPIYLGVRSQKWLACSTVLLIPVLMISAWISMIYRSTGHFAMINFSSSQNLFLGNNANTPLYRNWLLASRSDNPEELPLSYQALNADILRHPWYEQNTIYRRLAVQGITSRPDLFAVRTVNRMRSYFAFDSYTGSLLLNRYHTGRKLAFTAIAMDGILYSLLASSALFFLFTSARNSEGFWSAFTVAGMILVYAGPYFLSVSHPIYHYPVVPMMGILAAAFWSTRIDATGGFRESFPSGAKRTALILSLLLFAYVQVEYAVVMFRYSSH